MYLGLLSFYRRTAAEYSIESVVSIERLSGALRSVKHVGFFV